MKNDSARCIRNRESLRASRASSSSAFLMEMEIRTELMEDSTSTRSCSVRATTIGGRQYGESIPPSTSGVLYRSTCSDGNDWRHSTAVSVCRTASK